MKKILLLSVIAGALFAGCKKKEGTVSAVYTYSAPLITISGSQYYSIPVGGTLPTIEATSYDTFYNESYPVLIDQSTLDNTTPGLYAISATAKNKYGMRSSKVIYVGVTDVPATQDISGIYWRLSDPNRANIVTKLANGMYLASNVGGVDTGTQASSVVPAVFVVTSTTTIDFGRQETSQGTFSADEQTLSLAPPDTTISYVIKEPSSVFNTTVTRTFVKQ